MSTIKEELQDIKTVEDKLTANKVANFAYTDHAYDNPLTEADGVTTYNVENEQNIPIANADVLKVNPTILVKGWRSQASSITRMLMNHFLGRVSYNLNKLNDLFSSTLNKFINYLGAPDGIATLNDEGLLAQFKPVGSEYTPMTKAFFGALFGRLLLDIWEKGVGDNASYTTQYPLKVGDLYICCSVSHGMWWSEDGVSWNQNAGASIALTTSHVTYVNGIYVVCSESHGMWWSDDGKNWTQGTGDNASITMTDVQYHNGVWVATSEHGIWSSENGKDWSQYTTELYDYVTDSICFHNGLWNVTVRNNPAPVWWSEDGMVWEAGTWDTADDLSVYEEYVFVYEGVWFISGSGDVYAKQVAGRSTDGKSWTVISSSVSVGGTRKIYVDARGILVLNAYTPQQGQYIPATNSWSTSTDLGVTWVYQSSDYSYDIAQWYVNGVYLTNRFKYSTDGVTWNNPSGVSGSIRELIVTNGMIVVVTGGNYGYLYYSTDGRTWTRIGGTGSSMQYLMYQDVSWICCSNGDGIWHSTLYDLRRKHILDLPDIPLVD